MITRIVLISFILLNLFLPSTAIATDDVYVNTKYNFTLKPPNFSHQNSISIPVAAFGDTPKDGFSANIAIQIITLILHKGIKKA